MIKINDHVRLLRFPEQSPNGYGRVVSRADDGRFWVSTMNQPFSGAFAGWVKRSDLQKVDNENN